MRHQTKGRKFHRKKGGRGALLKHLLQNLFFDGKILTTEAKAKEMRPLAERLISTAKRQNIQALRILFKKLPKKTAMKVYHEVAPRYINRKGGYTRIIKSSGVRVGDGSRMAIVEFV